jgi:hypothetical protein
MIRDTISLAVIIAFSWAMIVLVIALSTGG